MSALANMAWYLGLDILSFAANLPTAEPFEIRPPFYSILFHEIF